MIPPIEKRSLIEDQMFPHYSQEANEGNVIIIEESIKTIPPFKLIAGETINKSWAVAQKTDGKCYHATIIAADEKPAIGISGTEADEGDYVEIIEDIPEPVSIGNVSFNISSPVWLCSPILTSPNITSTPPTQTSGRWNQRLGFAVEYDKIIVSIQTPRNII